MVNERERVVVVVVEGVCTLPEIPLTNNAIFSVYSRQDNTVCTAGKVGFQLELVLVTRVDSTRDSSTVPDQNLCYVF